MANYLFATVGGWDVTFKNEYVIPDNDLCGTRSGRKIPAFAKSREGGEEVFKSFGEWKEKLEYPIVDPVIEYCKQGDHKLDKIFLFVSNQKPPDNSDTIFFGKILKEHFKSVFKIDCNIKELTENPADFDKQYDAINHIFSEIENDINPKRDNIFIFPQTGSPATRNALLLNCILYFPKATQLAKPKGGGVTEQHFPQKFRNQVRIKSLPSTLKETLATISARNLSHTDGSHVMISFQKNLNEKLASLQKKTSETEFENLKNNYADFSDYLRGQMEYIADLSGQTASQTFFNYNFSSEAKYLMEIINSFLGNGLIDDLKQKNGTTENPVKVNLIYTTEIKVVSIPGGSNGINAFYTIVKNFIRNLYKHSSYGVEQDSGSPFYDIFIRLDESHWKDFYQVTLYDHNKYTNSQINEIINDTRDKKKGIGQCLNDKLLDDDGVVRDYGWGILEMKIAACYLMGLPLMYFDEPVNEKNEIDLSKKKTGKIFPKPLDVINYQQHLAYVFYLLKPETFLVIADEKSKKDESDLQKVGVNFFTGEKQDIDMNVRAKFIIDTRVNASDSCKLNNIREIDFFKGDFSALLKEGERKRIILEWQQKMFLNDGQTFDDFTKIDLNNISDKKKPTDNSNNKNLIMVDQHGDVHKSMDFSKLRKQGYFYYSTGCRKDKHDIPLGELKNLKWEEIEAIFTKVAVLDERIQDKANAAQHYIHQLSKRDLLELRGVYVPKLHGEETDAFDLRSLVFGNSVKDKNIDILEHIIEKFMKEYHYVVLHFSVLEKMAEKKKKKLATYYDSLVKKTQVRDHYLILTSGKGTPPTLPEGAYFISFASLERAVRNLSKVELVQHLNALRVHHKSK